ncbi:zinc ribbon domain-containing protein [Enterovibrio norvegicus]|uniref:zinc ribbon domain-containing protein n=1 Tax=Enterovibrio norvegicus TaxID=188144 RepID=UPI0024B272DF|nr:zinc ribbon domain-containing protein [Enterovibrio norvegicus]
MSPDEIFPIFFGTWVILGIISFAIFFLGKNAELKRKLWPPFVIGTGVLFIGFIYAMGLQGQALYIMVLAVILITFLNLRSAKFCDACGKTIISQNFLIKPKFCSKCGEKLQ